jgi:phosphoenolpyruvate-protein kinase (PTS system EI component)
MVGQVEDFQGLLQPGRRLLLDGSKGTITLDPPIDTVVPKAVTAPEPPVVLSEIPAGLPRIEVNINLLYEARPAVKLGASGVGLYRSEFLFLARRTLPTEDEQVTVYGKLVQMMEGRPVCVRTFDLRPDKLAGVSHLGSAATRPYDWRLVLESPPLQQLFREQVRAIMRAAVLGPLRILVPLVNRSEVLDFVMQTLTRARGDLSRDGHSFVEQLPIGVMIEVAAAVPLVKLWAEQIDFFALGTNDLTASALGVDRDDPVAANQIDSLHPGILRLIAEVVADAHQAGRTVSVCGEFAADPVGALALTALRVDSLSVPVNQFSTARQNLLRWRPNNLDDLRTQLLQQRSAQAVRALLSGWPS